MYAICSHSRAELRTYEACRLTVESEEALFHSVMQHVTSLPKLNYTYVHTLYFIRQTEQIPNIKKIHYFPLLI